MGEKITGNHGQLTQPPARSTNAGGPGPAGAADHPRSPAPGAGTPAPAQAGPRTPAPAPARTGKEAEGKGVPGLAVLSEGVPAPAEPKKKQRRKPSSKKKKEEPSFNAEQLSALIMTTSAIVASRPGMEIWALKPEEANQLASPIANMVEKSEKLKNMGEYADAISLVTASLIIFTPRAVIYAGQQKQKKIDRNGGVQLVDTRKRKPDQQKGKGEGSHVRTGGNDAAHAENHVTSIYDAIPEPF